MCQIGWTDGGQKSHLGGSNCKDLEWGEDACRLARVVGMLCSSSHKWHQLFQVELGEEHIDCTRAI